jgi:hypothetical protein
MLVDIWCGDYDYDCPPRVYYDIADSKYKHNTRFNVSNSNEQISYHKACIEMFGRIYENVPKPTWARDSLHRFNL